MQRVLHIIDEIRAAAHVVVIVKSRSATSVTISYVAVHDSGETI